MIQLIKEYEKMLELRKQKVEESKNNSVIDLSRAFEMMDTCAQDIRMINQGNGLIINQIKDKYNNASNEEKEEALKYIEQHELTTLKEYISK